MRRKRLPHARHRKQWLWIVGIVLAAALVVIWLVNIIAQFTAARSFGPELTSLCAGTVSAGELLDTMPEGKLAVLQGGGTRMHPWHNKLPDERRADSADQVDYVVCTQPSSYTVEVCKYTSGGRVKRIRYVNEVLFIDPELGELVAQDKVYGSYPDSCPKSKGVDLFTETIKGGKPGFKAFASLLAGQDPDAQLPVIPREPPTKIPVRPKPTVRE